LDCVWPYWSDELRDSRCKPATIISIGDLGIRGTVAIAGLVISALLVIRRVPGGLLIGIVVITVISFFVTDPETGNPVAGFQPGAYGIFDEIPSLAPVAFQLDLAGAFRLSLLLPIFSLFFVDFFDTVGGFVGIASKAGMIDERGDLKNGSRALVADSAEPSSARSWARLILRRMPRVRQGQCRRNG